MKHNLNKKNLLRPVRPAALALHDEASEPMPLSSSEALERALRMLDATPVTLTHKFGVLYVAGGQRHEAVSLSILSLHPTPYTIHH